ncbi:MAG TPA: prepilin-type N-terminal cleavage/methylation domain-containing protein [Planctomycetota bacterium]|nr:prepilin-type N-terminal cleavage/methylation domain-containing protein [Planctomycetota bacterium]
MAPSRRAQRGFTLIEILVVIAIIGLLMSILVVSLGRQAEAGRIADCRARLEQIKLLLESYANRVGDYPPSHLAPLGVKENNRVNEGVEALVVALKSSSYAGRRPEEIWLANTDGDKDDALKLADGSHALLELVDPWDNPIVYIANGDYRDEFVYRFGSGPTSEDFTLRAATNPLTQSPQQFDSFQLLSAGPDGLPGSEDDIANYEIPTQDD